MAGFYRTGGVYKELLQGFVRVSGVWKEITEGYVNVGGVWKLIHELDTGGGLIIYDGSMNADDSFNVWFGFSNDNAYGYNTHGSLNPPTGDVNAVTATNNGVDGLYVILSNTALPVNASSGDKLFVTVNGVEYECDYANDVNIDEPRFSFLSSQPTSDFQAFNGTTVSLKVVFVEGP